jgi:hypothetical protein
MNKLSIALVLVAAVGCSKKESADKPAAKVEETKAEPPKAEPPKAEPPKAEPPKAEPPKAPAMAAIKVDLPAGWDRTEQADGTSTLEYVAGVNDSKFPVDNAVFKFAITPIEGDDTLPADPAEFGSWYAMNWKIKLNKTEKLGDAVFFEFSGPSGTTPEDFTVVAKVNGKLVSCGGSVYRDADYNKIPKVRDEVIAQVKKICATMK